MATKSAKAIGRFYEDKVCAFYDKLGFNVWAVPSSRWGRGNKYRTTDIFNIFDLVAVSKDRFVMIQVKKDKTCVIRKKVLSEMSGIVMPEHIDREYWVFDDEGNALILCISGNKITKNKIKI